jgi:CubicO group peptidase (beta-lactamase class C family)
VSDLPHVTPGYAPQPRAVPWPTSEWPRADGPPGLDDAVDAAFSDPALAETQAVVVVAGGRVVAERYAGALARFDGPPDPVTRDRPMLSWSVAKSMLHFVVGTLVDEGVLDPDDEAAVPEWDGADDPRHEIRLADLLGMRDGIAWTENYTAQGTSDVIEMLFGAGKDDVAGFAAARPAEVPPGTRFNYSSGTSNVLSRLVADQVGAGDAYRRYLDERLFSPLGMASASPTIDAAGTWVASTFVHATALDFARFGLLYLRGGEWDGQTLVSRAWTDTAQRPLSVDPDDGTFHSWHWWVTGDEYGTYWASGYEGQMISVAPALDAVVVRLGKSPEDAAPARSAWRDRVLEAVAA